MDARKKGGPRVSGDSEELDGRLQAILLADSFASKFRPITLECPKVLLPLVNIPMINYTLAWLESAGVREVFVFCCAHYRQVIDYLESSGWFSRPNFSVTTIESHNSFSAGDALRIVYKRNVIHGDFVLVSGDIVSNMSPNLALEEHKEGRKKDASAIMTMVIKQSKPSQMTQESQLFMAIHPDTKQLLYYEDKVDEGTLSLDKNLLADNPVISLHNDKQDCHVYICSLESLSLLMDNFDYEDLQHHFVNRLLVDDTYVTRVDNFRSCNAISKDIIQRWTYPYLPDLMFYGNLATKLERQGMCPATEIALSHCAQIGPFSVIGYSTKIGDNTTILNSVIGEGCNIGSDISIEGSYIWNNVTIEDGCKLERAVVCDGVIIKSGAVLKPGVVLSFKVVIGQKFVVPAYSKVSLLPQPTEPNSDVELEYADSSSGAVEPFCTVDTLNREISSESTKTQCGPSSKLGTGGVGYIWSMSEGGHEEEWRHSEALIPDEFSNLIQDIDDNLQLDSNSDGIVSENEYFEDNDNFESKVDRTLSRAVLGKTKLDDAVLELQALRLSYNMASMDCVGAILHSLMKLAIKYPHSSNSELWRNVANVINSWHELLTAYVCDIDHEIKVILEFEEMCFDSAREFAPLFAQILHLLHDNGIVQQKAIFKWADEKEFAHESETVFVNQSAEFLQWLREASSSEEED